MEKIVGNFFGANLSNCCTFHQQIITSVQMTVSTLESLIFLFIFLFLYKNRVWYSDSCIKFLIFYMTIICVFKLPPSFVESKHFCWWNSIKTHYDNLFKGNKPNTRFRCFLNSIEFSARDTLLWRYFIGMIITLFSLTNSCFILIKNFLILSNSN